MLSAIGMDQRKGNAQAHALDSVHSPCVELGSSQKAWWTAALEATAMMAQQTTATTSFPPTTRYRLSMRSHSITAKKGTQSTVIIAKQHKGALTLTRAFDMSESCVKQSNSNKGKIRHDHSEASMLFSTPALAFKQRLQLYMDAEAMQWFIGQSPLKRHLCQLH